MYKNSNESIQDMAAVGDSCGYHDAAASSACSTNGRVDARHWSASDTTCQWVSNSNDNTGDGVVCCAIQPTALPTAQPTALPTAEEPVRVQNVTELKIALSANSSWIQLIGNISLTGHGEVEIRGASGLVLEGNGFTIGYNKSVAGQGRVLSISHSNMTIHHLIVKNGYVTGNPGNGGGLLVSSSTLGLVDCTIKGSTAAHYGGGLRADYSTVAILRTSFLSCVALQHGGGLHASYEGTVITLTDSRFWGCSAVIGGGLHVFKSKVVMHRSTVANCTADEGGGGFCCSISSTVEIYDSSISDCTASLSGGGLWLLQLSSTIISGSVIDSCRANDGGGIYGKRDTDAMELTISGSSLTRCTASGGGGGGISWLALGSMAIAGSSFTNCGADQGGGIYVGDGGAASSAGGYFDGNYAHVSGADLYLASGANFSVSAPCVLSGTDAASSGHLDVGGAGRDGNYSSYFCFAPTSLPTSPPTLAPTLEPTALPTAVPTLRPSLQPTVLPQHLRHAC